MIALLSNVNVDPIKRFFPGEDIYLAPFGQVLQELVSPSSPLLNDNIERLVVVLDADELVGDSLHILPVQSVRDAVLRNLEQLLAALKQFVCMRPAVSVTLTNFAISPFRFTTFLETNSELGFATLQREMNTAVANLARNFPNVLVLDWERLVALHGFNALFTSSFWYMARVKFNHRALKLLAEECRLLWRAWSSPPKKVLVLDLDNTLWGGVVGDLGPNGIVLSEDGQGKAFRDFQKSIRSLKEIGVLLAINSKNSDAVVHEAFASNSMMALRFDDFVCTRINWHDKATNMVEIANELSLGVDSLVFLDDSPVERAIVSQSLPEVAVPHFPTDPVDLPHWFQESIVRQYFGRIRLTTSDRAKTEQYHARAQRSKLATHLSVEDTIRELGIVLTVGVDCSGHAPRIAQMTQKTNQFNMTTRRCTEQEINAEMQCTDKHIITVEYEDRFGKEGVVGVAFCSWRSNEFTINNFLMSCRVLGRTVEHAFLHSILVHAARAATVVRAEFVPSTRNCVAKAFYPECGFTESEPGVFSASREQVLASLENKRLIDEVRINEIG